MVDLSSEKHLWWNHGVFVRQEELAIEDATFIRGLRWTSNLDEEMSGVVLIWLSVDTDDWVLGESLSFLCNVTCQTQNLIDVLTLRILGGIDIYVAI